MGCCKAQGENLELFLCLPVATNPGEHLSWETFSPFLPIFFIGWI